MEEYAESILEDEDRTDLHKLAEGVLNGNGFAAGDEFGTVADWGIWEIEGASVDGAACIRASTRRYAEPAFSNVFCFLLSCIITPKSTSAFSVCGYSGKIASLRRLPF